MANDEAAFREAVARYGPALRRVAVGYAGEDGEEDDLYQEILFQAWRSLPRFRGDSALSTWLYRIALNTALTHRRRRRRRDRINSLAPPPAATAGDPRGQAALLRDFLASLDGLDRSVALLYLEDLSNGDIGEVLGLSTGAVAVRVHRIKIAFRDRYMEG